MLENRILTTLNWESRVRDKLGVDEPYLPDTAIQQPEAITLAESYVIGNVPNYESLSEEDTIWIEAAVVSKCAALLCPTMKARMPTREQGPHFTRDITQDWDAMAQELSAQADNYMSMIVFIEGLHRVEKFGKTW